MPPWEIPQKVREYDEDWIVATPSSLSLFTFRPNITWKKIVDKDLRSLHFSDSHKMMNIENGYQADIL